MMTEVNLTVIIIIVKLFIIHSARIPMAGNYDPFDNENQPQTDEHTSNNKTHVNVNLPSLDSLHDQVHQSLDINETVSNIDHGIPSEKAGPSLDIIDSHSHDDDNSSIIDSARRALIQPSIDFLDAQLHGGDEHVHDKNQTEGKAAADLNDYRRWLEEQTQTNQLNRFLLLQKEVNQYHLSDANGLNDKINRTIEELKSTVKTKQRRHDL